MQLSQRVTGVRDGAKGKEMDLKRMRSAEHRPHHQRAQWGSAGPQLPEGHCHWGLGLQGIWVHFSSQGRVGTTPQDELTEGLS